MFRFRGFYFLKILLMRYIITFCLFSTFLVAQITKMEPPFWYENMNHSNLQILFYGPNISQSQVEVSNGMKIIDIAKTENSNYLFVTVDTKNLPAKTYQFSFKNAQGKISKKHFELKKRIENSAQRKSFDASDVMYLIMPDRFANGNTKNDSHASVTEKVNRALPEGRHGGDIAGIINNLDYLQNLGITTIWNTPMCEDNDAVYSYHGYAQSDLYKIDPRYGSNEDYLQLSLELKKRNMKLVKDYVTNHWGAQHWMFKDLPSYDWFHQFPGFAQSNYRMTTQFDTNASKIDAKYCMDGWFVPSMPDLNQSNPLVLNYLIQNAIWWIEFANLDGFRVDTYSYNDKIGIAKWTKAITDEYPNFNIVGEIWMHDQAQISYWQKDSPISAIQNYNSHLPAVMDFTLHDAVGNVFNENQANWSDGMIKVYENFTNDFLYSNTNNLLVFLENHDTGRFNQNYKNDFKKYQLGMTLISTVRGIPQLYYGSEIGMAGEKSKGDADIRRDFPGGWNGDQNNAFLKDSRTEIQSQYHDFTAKLLNWRKGKDVIHSGKTTHYLPENNVYVYFRHNETESVMVIINNSDQAQELKTARFAENLKNYKSGIEILSAQNLSIDDVISVQPTSSQIIELK